MVDICTPEPLAAIVPATPEERTCVVETGKPKLSAAAIVAHRHDLGRRALAIGQMLLADLFADRDDDALPSDHGAKPKRERDRHLYPDRE